MGRLVEGKWRTGSIISSDKKGSYDKIPRSFRDSIPKVGPFSPESMHYRTYKKQGFIYLIKIAHPAPPSYPKEC